MGRMCASELGTKEGNIQLSEQTRGTTDIASSSVPTILLLQMKWAAV